ncbi:MAG TPA: nodulation protein NfeD [Bacteroidota bacterium]|nr:nodulation protein NfeD [Bacteroidota bacterium]
MLRRWLSLFVLTSIPAAVFGQSVLSVSLDGMINPSASEYLHDALAKAEELKVECVVIQLNTPGGLLKSTRLIVGDILESSVPVVVYIAPGGAQAGSAGVFITLAANIAAMAPGTNIGAAHPVTEQGQMDSIMNEKATNDAAAFIRSIAEKRNRNLQWAEEAVRKSLSITETEALGKHVIDLIARNLDDLLDQLDGRQVMEGSGNVVLHTKGARLIPFEMGWTEKTLGLLSDPNIAYILMMLGFYGLMFELYNPGSILPGVVGVISLILAFYSFHTLPINYAGLALIVFGVILFLLEIKVASHGILAIGGTTSLLLGSMMLVRSDSSLEFVSISTSIILTTVGVSVVFFLFVIGLAVKAQRAKPTTGKEGMMGEIGEVLVTLNPRGTVMVHGETWNAESASGKINKGEQVRVARMENLTLFVEKKG